ncbi:hypothetical protein [Metallibacterium scheffleri]|uniref:TubC N-terminal docking domain-containing protein n=1 Tax=Metallibacterium scheffleri TaxID=993689 RepID=A0A4S3KNL4_9GAMM|nr:hypothetical protein [Metallibacterium scheffleri]THD09694.1 hypothetical protein B1806_10195 [Metallibacterium scheffleri]
MNALRQLQHAGVSVRRDGDVIEISTQSGEPLPVALIELARKHKAELLALLPDAHAATRERLHAIAKVHGIGPEIVRAVATDRALGFCMPMSDAALTRWLNITGTREAYRIGTLKHGWLIPSAAHMPEAVA